MPEFHAEPYLYLAGLTHKSALIAWGAFYFRVKKNEGKFKLIDDSTLKHVHPPRRETIGARSEPYGDGRVEVYDKSGTKLIASAATTTSNHCWVAGLEPDTEYSYKVIVKSSSSSP
jgi:tartrate-resistant acid phosphatase type 5